MPRAHRHFVSGHIWHITHRCHGREFLLDSSNCRQVWLRWLRRAQDRHGLLVLGYAVTSNHVHLLVQDPGIPKAISRAMQLLQGRTAQEYNNLTGRINAFWGDRYHATAVESGIHLMRCLAYIDLNMVRAKAVEHPSEWQECGYREIQGDGVRSGIIDVRRLAVALGCRDLQDLRTLHRTAINDGMRNDALKRDDRWTESIAVGSQTFVSGFAVALGSQLHGRTQEQNDDSSFCLREPEPPPYCSESSVFLPGDNTTGWMLDECDD